MKKSLIALAVLAASGAAMAQSSVTLYGRADVNYTWDSATSATGVKYKQNSGGLGGSRIGFRGVEDLGNGLKAGFVIENSASLDDGTGAFGGGRQAFISLAGGFGEARFGRQYTLQDGFAGTYGGAFGTVWNNNATVISSNGTRNSNAATYISPNFSGFTVKGQVATKEQYTDSSGKQVAPYALALDYANGPVGIGFTAGKNGAVGDKAIYQLGGSYDFGPVALLGAYEYDRNKDDKKAWTLGAKAPFGATTLRASYGVVDQAAGTASGGRVSQVLFNGQKVRVAGLGADYKLSKRSTVYAGYAYVKGEAGTTATGGKKSVNQVTVGFDHWF